MQRAVARAMLVSCGELWLVLVRWDVMRVVDSLCGFRAALVLGLWLVGVCGAGITPRIADAAQRPLVILISIDGYRYDYLDRGHSPVLAALAADGVRAKSMRPAFPSLTFPNHYTLVTGRYPDHHGIVNNIMLDPELGKFSLTNRAAHDDGRWWDEAEPIWVTAEKHGVRTAVVFWPGSQAEIHATRPEHWLTYNQDMPLSDRVDQALQWIDLPGDQKPGLVLTYLEPVDTNAHWYGLNSPQETQALDQVDAALARLFEGLRQRGLFESSNLVIVSDHGMSESSLDRVVLLDKIAPADDFEMIGSGPLAGIKPKPGHEAAVAKALLAAHEHMQCWKKSEIPAKFHYGTNARIPAIVCLAERGWLLTTTQEKAGYPHPIMSTHGYSIEDPQMQAIFIAHGPAFKHGVVVPPFDNIHVYSLLTQLLDVPPAPNDGSLGPIASVLKDGEHLASH